MNNIDRVKQIVEAVSNWEEYPIYPAPACSKAHLIEELCWYLDACDVDDDEKIETERRWRFILCPQTLIEKQTVTTKVLNTVRKAFVSTRH